MPMNDKSLNIKYSVIMGLHWAVIAISSAFLTQLLQFKGCGNWEIGVIGSVKLMATIVFQVLIGSLADRYRDKIPLKNIVGFLSFLTAAETAVLYLMPNSFWGMIILFIGFGGTLTCLAPLIDALSMIYSDNGRYINYTAARGCGSVTWAIGCVLIGIVCDKFGVINILIIQLVLCILLAIASYRLDKIKPKNVSYNKQKEVKIHSSYQLIRDYKSYRIFILSSIFLYMGYMFSTMFLIDLVEKLGGNNTHYGIIEFVMAISEVPSAYIFYKVYKSSNLNKIFVCSTFFMTIKCFLTAFSVNITMLVLIQLLEMFSFGLYYATTVQFVNINLPKQDSVKAISVINAANVGLGEGVGSFCGGFLRDVCGLTGLIIIAGIASGISFLLAVSMLNLNKKIRA